MPPRLVLASASETRRDLLRRAGVSFTTDAVKLDEAAVRDAMTAAGEPPRNIADALAEAKAKRAAARNADALVLGCDQVLSFEGTLLSKPGTQEEAVAQLTAMSGKRHTLISAAVIYWNDAPQWRHIGTVQMTMRHNSRGYLGDYVARNWASIRHSVGAYKLEEEGVRLFTQVQGDYFCVLGLPLLEILDYLITRKVLPE